VQALDRGGVAEHVRPCRRYSGGRKKI
jgi:hypothetical protein